MVQLGHLVKLKKQLLSMDYNKINKIIYTIIITIIMALVTGCATISGNPEVANMDNADKFEISKTTMKDVKAYLGECSLVFDKENGVKKYVYTGVVLETYSNGRTLVLYFDKDKVLIKKELIIKHYYVDPDVQKMMDDLVKGHEEYKRISNK